MAISKWCFPSNSGGDEQGLNNSLIETFNDSPIKSLAREIVQNSLDAALTGKQAIVEFKSFSLIRDAFPGCNELSDIMVKCQEFARNEKTVKFFEDAKKVLASDKIHFLRISDFNTKGLRGSDKERGTDWSNLVRSTGSSDKNGEKGGSFGIGKGAPFACSALRTVFYSTLDCEGQKASQGVSRLTSFKLGKFEDGSDDISQGVGYFGIQEPHKILPNNEMLVLDESFKRETSGTDIYIAGLRENIYQDTNELQATIINEVLDGFIMAIWNEKLEVRVNSFVINKSTLPTIIEKFKDKLSSSTIMNFELLSKDVQWETIDISIANVKIGSLKLAISLRHDGNNKISMIRSTGMKILDKDKLCPTMRFVGIAVVEGKVLNERLIKLENPSHNKWEPKRFDPATSQKLLNTMYDLIKDKLNEFAEKTFSSTVDIEGAGEFLPDDISAGEEKQPTKKTEVINRIVNIEKKVKTKVDSVANLSTFEIGEDLREKVDSEGNIIEGTDEEGFMHHGGKSHGDGERDPEEVSFEEGDGNTGKKVVLVKAKHFRIFCIDKKNQFYRLIFTPNESSKKAYLAINKVAELSEKEAVKILSVKGIGNPTIIKNKVGYVELEEGLTKSIDVQIEGQDYCSMEVKIYAYKG